MATTVRLVLLAGARSLIEVDGHAPAGVRSVVVRGVDELALALGLELAEAIIEGAVTAGGRA